MVISKVLYVIVIAVLLIVTILFSYYPAYLAFLLAIVIPAVFLAILIINRLCIAYSADIENTSVVKGDRVRLNINLKNVGPFPSGNIRTVVELYYGNEKRIKKLINTQVMPFSKIKNPIDITAEYTGTMTIVVKKAVLYDYIKLFSFKFIRKAMKYKTMVLPRPFFVDIAYTYSCNDELADSDTYHPYKKGYDRTETFNIRDYAPGDSLRDVHWKLSTKLDKYMVKEYSLPISIGIDILADFTVMEKDLNNIIVQDKLIEIFYSACFSLNNQNKGFNCAFINRLNNSYEAYTITDEEELIMMTGRVIESLYGDNKENMATESMLFENIRSNNILYITTTLTEELITKFNEMTAQSKICIIFVMTENNRVIIDNINRLPNNCTYLMVNANSVDMGNINEIRF